MANSKRTFIALKIVPSPALLDAYRKIKAVLEGEKIKWVEENNMHVTLAFLGDTTVDLIDQITSNLEESLYNTDPVSLKIAGIGVFKNMHEPRVLWMGTEPDERMIATKMEIDQKLRSLGFEIEEREFRPHLTLGRIKFINNKKKLREIIDEFKGAFFMKQVFGNIEYIESQLTPNGPKYSTIKQISFARGEV